MNITNATQSLPFTLPYSTDTSRYTPSFFTSKPTNFLPFTPHSGNYLSQNASYLNQLNLSINSYRPFEIYPDQLLALQINNNELKTISFDKILDVPHSINSLFSEEMRELIKNLVEIQKQKISLISNSSVEGNHEVSIKSHLNEQSISQLASPDMSSNPNIQINHLLNSSSEVLPRSNQTEERNQSQRPKPPREEQSEVPYFNRSKREAKSLLKTLLTSLGKRLGDFAKILENVGA